MGRFLFASTERPGRARRALELATSWVERTEDIQKLDLPADHAGPGDHLGLPEAFNATPEPLIESWRVAQVVDYATEPGDTIVITDRQGVSGVLALEQSMRSPETRRRVVVVAGEGTYLRFRSHAGTAAGLAESVQSEVDWELVAYTWADAVITPASWVVDELALLGVEAQLMDVGLEPPAPITAKPNRVWLPEPVVRASRTGTILRALNTNGETDLTVMLSPEDGPDEVWTGSTWEALDGLRLVHCARLERTDQPEEPDLILLGDRTAVPDDAVRRLVRSGVPVIVPEGSTAAALWPRAPTWRDGPDLVDSLKHAPTADHDQIRSPALELPPRSRPVERAKNVSVGIPVFRDVRFLEECIESLLSQTEAPFEILIYDDGSNLDAVELELRKQAGRDSRVRVLSGPNQGVCVARNRMLEVMGGDAFVFVDADDRLHESFLKKTATGLRQNPDVSAVATWTRFFGTYEAVDRKSVV